MIFYLDQLFMFIPPFNLVTQAPLILPLLPLMIFFGFVACVVWVIRWAWNR